MKKEKYCYYFHHYNNREMIRAIVSKLYELGYTMVGSDVEEAVDYIINDNIVCADFEGSLFRRKSPTDNSYYKGGCYTMIPTQLEDLFSNPSRYRFRSPITVGGCKVEYQEGGDIKVGCTHVDFDTLEQIYKQAKQNRS